MNAASTVNELRNTTAGALEFNNGDVKVLNREQMREQAVDKLAWTAAFSTSDETRSVAMWLIRALARQMGNGPASINEVYFARGRGDLPHNFTVPAINIRAFAYYFARAIFRAAKKCEAGAILCELSRSEMGYTNQTPAEYVTSVLAAALREGYPWPVFIQGDHFQINAANFAKDPVKEIEGVKKLTKEALAAGFGNVDLDTSTLVDLSKPTLAEQQDTNCRQCADLSAFVRKHQPKGITVSLGGEIGEVGGKNSTVEELEAFMQGYARHLPSGLTGISKISVQTGTAHGGVVLSDGTMAQVKLDFEALENISKISREKFGLAGAVQHGASTLPSELFGRFPETGTCEIHLATEFQNILYEHPAFPGELKKDMYGYLSKECAKERKEKDTDTQFFYKTRKKALGPFKQELWGLPDGIKEELMAALESKVDGLLHKLNVGGTGPLIKPFVTLPDAPVTGSQQGKSAKAEQFEGDD